MDIVLPAKQKKADFIAFTGGLDTITPTSVLAPGFVKDAQNYEEDINGGYRTVAGYERFDGHVSPSLAQYFVLNFSAPGSVVVGSTITGAISGATGKVIAITPTYFVITRATGTFVAESTTTLGAVVTGYSGVQGITDRQYKFLAANEYRNDIGVVPGTGPILGVWYYRGTVYAFRNAVGGGVGMYKSSAIGWTAVPLGFEVSFTGGSGTQPLEGATITKGATSAVLARLVVETGTFAGNNATGRFIFASVTGGPFTAGALTGGATATVVTQAAISFAVQSGRFEFVTANFYGRENQARMYGCDGKNRAFEFDGTTLVPLNTGFSPDRPSHVIEHQKHLFLAQGSSIINSAIGNPLNYTTTLGAAEQALSDTVTGFLIQPGVTSNASLGIYCRNKLFMLYGTSSANWSMIKYSDEAGSLPFTIQRIFDGISLDDVGILSMSAAQEYGNFAASTLSSRFQNWLDGKRSSAVDSYVVRRKQQYRLFFNDGSACYLTVTRKKVAMMPVMLPNKVVCSCSQEAFGNSDELIFAGSDNGYVYQMETGTSFDGVEIEAYVDLVFNHGSGYRGIKKYRRITFEATGNSYFEFFSTYRLGYDDIQISQPDQNYSQMDLSAVNWDAFTWDEFVWDGRTLLNNSLSTPGDGENISVIINSRSALFDPIKFNACFIEYTPLRQMR